MNELPNEPADSALPSEELVQLPLGYQTIWQHPLLPREALRAITVRNTRWWSTGVAPSSPKPISKIVLSTQEGDHGSDSAP